MPVAESFAEDTLGDVDVDEVVEAAGVVCLRAESVVVVTVADEDEIGVVEVTGGCCSDGLLEVVAVEDVEQFSVLSIAETTVVG